MVFFHQFLFPGLVYEFLLLSFEIEQSSGKSSVLESIVGRDFLPRGSGLIFFMYFSFFEIFLLFFSHFMNYVLACVFPLV